MFVIEYEIVICKKKILIVTQYNLITQTYIRCRPTGLKVVIDFGRPSGKRVQSIHARCGNCAVPVYEKLNLNANYTMIVSDYLSNGGDGFSFKKVVEYQSFGECDTAT